MEAFIKASLIEPENPVVAGHLQELTRLSGRDSAGLFKLQGLKWLQEGQNHHAKNALQAALALNPGDEEISRYLEQMTADKRVAPTVINTRKQRNNPGESSLSI